MHCLVLGGTRYFGKALVSCLLGKSIFFPAIQSKKTFIFAEDTGRFLAWLSDRTSPVQSMRVRGSRSYSPELVRAFAKN